MGIEKHLSSKDRAELQRLLRRRHQFSQANKAVAIVDDERYSWENYDEDALYMGDLLMEYVSIDELVNGPDVVVPPPFIDPPEDFHADI